MTWMQCGTRLNASGFLVVSVSVIPDNSHYSAACSAVLV